MPPVPSSYDGTLATETVDLRDRVPRQFFGGLVTCTFPVTLERSFEHFKALRDLEDWKPFTARGQRDKETGKVKPMDMGSCKLPFILKPCTVGDEERIPLYPFTYLTFKKGTAKKGNPERNWSFWRWSELQQPISDVMQVFGQDNNHVICKLYRSFKDLNSSKDGNKKSDGIGWHQDNGGIRKFQDLHHDNGFQDLILYPDESSYRWLQVWDPETKKTCNLLLPSGALVTFTGAANRRLFHCVPKDYRNDLGERITVVARQMITYYNWDTRKVYRAATKKRKTEGGGEPDAKKQREY